MQSYKYNGKELDTKKGLQVFSQFLRNAKKAGMEFKGLNWQQNAGKAFRINNVNQQGLKYFGKGLKTTGVISSTKKRT